jgi:peptidoglycan/xylan/chitin deacetylase (PgdA/CDA1 family)
MSVKGFQQAEPRNLHILNFHGIGDSDRVLPASEKEYWVPLSLFQEILEGVHDRIDVQITFDDSNETDYSVALPVLKATGMKARFFVVAERIGQEGFLTGNQIQSLCAEGFTIGNHGMRHRSWKHLGQEALYEELVQAKAQIEQVTGVPVAEAACPFGGYNRRVLRRLREWGYSRVYTSDGGPASTESWVQARNTIRSSDNVAKVLSLIDETPSGLKRLWRGFKLALKRWR